MVEVFKTNVVDEAHAIALTTLIAGQFTGYVATFDLDDCDHILCVRCTDDLVAADCVIAFLKDHNCIAEILADEIPNISTDNFKPEALTSITSQPIFRG